MSQLTSGQSAAVNLAPNEVLTVTGAATGGTGVVRGMDLPAQWTFGDGESVQVGPVPYPFAAIIRCDTGTVDFSRTAPDLTDLSALDGVTATAAELNDADLSLRTQAIASAGAIALDARHVKITGPASSTYAVTLAAPSRAGIVKVVEMVATTGSNAVTLALTNVVGGSAGSSASFNAAGETLVLVSANDKWAVLAEVGVTLS